MSHLTLLPNGILVLILTFLTKFYNPDRNCHFTHPYYFTLKQLFECALVNRALFAASIPLLWQHPIHPIVSWKVEINGLSLLSCLQSSPRPAYLGQYIRRLNLHGDDSIKQVVPFMSYIPLLHNLRLSVYRGPFRHSCHSICPLLREILPYCPRLERLYLSTFEISDSTLVSIGQWCSQIQDLELNDCTGFTSDALTTLLADYRTSLTSLTLFVNSGWKTRFGRTLDLFQLQHLTSLSVHHCLAIDNDFFSRTGFAPHLTTLRISQCNVDFSNTSELLLRFLCTHPLLYTLHLGHCRLNNWVLAGLTPAVIPSLELLNLSHNGHPISSQAVRQMVKRCLCLSEVILGGCRIPARCFPEVNHWPERMGVLSSISIGKIRRSDPDLIITAEDDIFWEGSVIYYSGDEEEEEAEEEARSDSN